MSVAAVSSRIPRSESLEVAGQEQESDEVEDAQVDFCCCTERSVFGGTRNLRYGVINCIVRTCIYARARHFPIGSPSAVPPVYDRRPGRFVRHIDFNHFRTIGMRRSLEEGVSSRFVTAERLEVVLKVSPGPAFNDRDTRVNVWLHSDVIPLITF